MATAIVNCFPCTIYNFLLGIFSCCLTFTGFSQIITICLVEIIHLSMITPVVSILVQVIGVCVDFLWSFDLPFILWEDFPIFLILDLKFIIDFVIGRMWLVYLLFKFTGVCLDVLDKFQTIIFEFFHNCSQCHDLLFIGGHCVPLSGVKLYLVLVESFCNQNFWLNAFTIIVSRILAIGVTKKFLVWRDVIGF